MGRPLQIRSCGGACPWNLATVVECFCRVAGVQLHERAAWTGPLGKVTWMGPPEKVAWMGPLGKAAGTGCLLGPRGAMASPLALHGTQLRHEQILPAQQ